MQLGARLRAARLARGYTLDQVAAAADLTKGFLSRLERDDASPSVASLVRVCDVLGLRVGALFDPPETAVVRAGRGKAINFGGEGTAEHLLTPGTQQQLEVIHAVLDGGGSGGSELYSLDCEVEFVFVVAGRLDVVLADEVVSLAAGDAMTFPGQAPHTWRNGSSVRRAEVLWVLSPAP